MKKQDNYVSEETAMWLLHAGIIEEEQPAPTLTECIVWFAEQNISIITDYNSIDHEWTALACGNNPRNNIHRYSQSYIEVMNAAIRDAAVVYKKLKSTQR